MREPSTLESRQAKLAARTKGHAPEMYEVKKLEEDIPELGLVSGTEILVMVASQSQAISTRAQTKDVLNEKKLVGSFKCFRPVLHDAGGKHPIERYVQETAKFS